MGHGEEVTRHHRKVERVEIGIVPLQKHFHFERH